MISVSNSSIIVAKDCVLFFISINPEGLYFYITNRLTFLHFSEAKRSKFPKAHATSKFPVAKVNTAFLVANNDKPDASNSKLVEYLRTSTFIAIFETGFLFSIKYFQEH